MINGLHLFIAVPLFFAALCAFLNRRPRLAAAIANAVFVSGFLYACYNFAANFGAPWFAGEAVYSAFLLIIIFLVSAAVAFFANFAASTKRRGSYFAVLLIAAAGMAGVALAKDFFTLYVYLEVVSVTSFALIAFYNRPKSTEGAIKYFYLSAIASAIILFSVSLLVLHTGGSSYQGLVDVALKNQNPAALSIILGLMALAFMIKTGLFPFHTWTPDAYEAASSPISALMAGIVTKIAGAYALVIICVLLVIINQGLGGVSKAIMWYGLISILFGALAAQEQKDFKRMLAYSSISQMGYIVLAAALATPLAVAGAVFHMFNHATFKTLLFFCAGNVKKAAGTTSMEDIHGLQSKMPYTSAMAAVGMLATAGLPPFSGFWSKLFIIAALWQAGFYGMAAAALFASVLTLAYFLKLQRGMFFGNPSANIADVKEKSLGFLLPCFVFAAIITGAGLYFPFMYNNFLEPLIKVLR